MVDKLEVDEAGEHLVHHPDPRVRIAWSLHILGAGLLFWVVATMVAGALFTSLIGIDRGFFPLLFFSITLVIVLPHIVWVELNYQNYTYEFGKKRIRISKGVFNRERVIIPYTKIQNLYVMRSVLERVLGIATVKIETAGGNPKAEGVIEGVADPQDFVQKAMEIVERKKREIKREEMGAIEPKKAASEDEINYLKEILEELKELKKVMGKTSKPRKPFPKG